MGMAIIWIVLFHVYLWTDMSDIKTTWWIESFDKGALGVDIFLLLSAFGLQASIDHNSIGRFYQNRLKRLFPVYLFFLFCLFLVFERNCPLDRVVIQCLCQITGLSLFKYPEFFSCGFCFDWFTPAIILVYIVFPIISKTVVWIHRKGILAEVIVLLLCVFVGSWIRENKHFPFGLLAFRFPIIYLGITTYLYLKNGEIKHLLLIILIGACYGLLSGNEEMRLSLLLPPVLTIYSLLPHKLPLFRSIGFIGRYSFEIYLAHIFPVAFIIPLKISENVFVLLLLTVVATIFISCIFICAHKILCHFGNKITLKC
jgi:peptidoglycan/LPS O-acetylase OafA/YrhL